MWRLPSYVAPVRSLRRAATLSDIALIVAATAKPTPPFCVVIVRLRGHPPTLDYIKRRTAEGKSKAEIIRCLVRYVAREIFGYLCNPSRAVTQPGSGH